jgi:Ca-activated chloride channel family protein
MPEAFHFQHPQWFWLLLPLLLLWWRMRRPRTHDNPWRRVCDAHLLPYLLIDTAGRAAGLPAWLLGCAWLLAVIALADPVWDRQPQPVFRSQEARVVVLDLSRSMLAADLPPSRLARARFKVADILDRSPDGQTGLVVFAGDAFAVAPLSNDTDTIRSLLAPLEPQLMPVQGSRVDLGLAQASDLLTQAGQVQGEILLITDGYTGEDALQAARELRAAGYRLSVLGVGTAAGAPLADGQGGYLRDAQGNIVMPQLDVAALRKLATVGGGRYVGISSTDQDLRYLLAGTSAALGTDSERTDLTTEAWRSRGPWLVLLLLPLAALLFRRGWLLVLLLQVGMGLGVPRPAMALGWNDLWLRPDQQAARSLQAGVPAEAAQLARDPALRGTGAYLAGDYQQALDAFAAAGGADGDYNQGNSLAQLGRYQEAIAAYERALAAQPGMEDAAYNKAQLEKMLQQQQQQQQENNQGQQSESQQQSGEQQQAAQTTQDPSSAAEEGQKQSQPESTDTAETEPQDAAAGEANRNEAGSGAEQDAAEQQARARQQSQPSAADESADASAAGAQPADLDSEEQQAAEQWLRRIPDDPGGLLRRKFLYQYRQRAGTAPPPGDQAW